MPESYPLLCEPLMKDKIWGGRKLQAHFDYLLPHGIKIGEAWITADLPEGSSKINNGPYAGRSLTDVTRIMGEQLIGTAWKGHYTSGRFPLLIKLLDAADDLSVQVHPDYEACQQYFPKDHSKDESWIIIQSDPEGSILQGFKPGTTYEQYELSLKNGTILDCLQRYQVQPGDVYRIPPGTVHALCKGVLLLEVQEPSDSTFRIYDYNRLGNNGKPRMLHLDESRKAIKFNNINSGPVKTNVTNTSWGRHELLVNTSSHRIERLSLIDAHNWTVDPRSVQVFFAMEGQYILHAKGESFSIHDGDAVILPADIGEITLKPREENNSIILIGAKDIPLVQ